MAKLSIGQAWNEATSFVGRNLQPVFLIALATIALPNILLQLAAGLPAADRFSGETAAPGYWMLLIPLVAAAGLIGGLALAWLAIRASTTVGEALAVGLRRIVPLLGALLILLFGALALFVPLTLLVVGADVAAFEPQALAGGALLLMILFVIVVFIISVRLVLATPVAAAERVGPIDILRRSWELTAGHFWRLFGFFLLFGIASMIAMLAIGLVFGVLFLLLFGSGGQPSGVALFLSVLVDSAVQAVWGALFTITVARIYAQLTGPDAADVFG